MEDANMRVRMRGKPARGSGAILLLITGMPGCGKSTAVGILREMGFEIVEMGTHVVALAKSLGIRTDAAGVSRLASALRRLAGKEVVARMALPAVRAARGNVAVSGVRSIEEAEYIAAHAAQRIAYLIAITAPRGERVARIIARRRGDALSTAAAIGRIEAQQRRWGIGRLIRKADFVIPNISTKAALRRKLRRLLHSVTAPSRQQRQHNIN